MSETPNTEAPAAEAKPATDKAAKPATDKAAKPATKETKETKPKADKISTELKGYDLSAASVERRIVRDGGSLELRVVIPAPSK